MHPYYWTWNYVLQPVIQLEDVCRRLGGEGFLVALRASFPLDHGAGKLAFVRFLLQPGKYWLGRELSLHEAVLVEEFARFLAARWQRG